MDRGDTEPDHRKQRDAPPVEQASDADRSGGGLLTAILLGAPDPFTEVISHLDSNDTRMQQTWLANGAVWGPLDTDIVVNGQHQAGIEYFVLNPNSGKLKVQGTLALADTHLTYPAVAALPNGQAVLAFTLVGTNNYASAAYAGLDASTAPERCTSPPPA